MPPVHPPDRPGPTNAPTVEPPESLAKQLDYLENCRTFVEHYTDLLKTAKERVTERKAKIIAAMEAAGVESVSYKRTRYWLHRASHNGKAVDLGSESCMPADEILTPEPPKVAEPVDAGHDGEAEVFEHVGGTDPWTGQPGDGFDSSETVRKADPVRLGVVNDPPAWLSEDEKQRRRPRPRPVVSPAFGGPSHADQ